MNEFFRDPQGEVEVAHAAAIIEHELRNGFFLDIASAKVDALPGSLSPREVAEIILREPKGGEPLKPRWTLVDEAEAAEPAKAAIAANDERIITTAEVIDLRKIVYGERQSEDVSSIDPEKAVFLVESGANKTSIVRRGVAVKAMRELYGDDLSSNTLYQLGGGREIHPTRELKKPGGTTETVVNKEYETIRSLAGDLLPAAGPFTEFDGNLATALAEGYQIADTHDTSDGTVLLKIELTHPDLSHPSLVLIQPGGKGGLEAGFDALKPVIEDHQLVVATNGQYRQKDIYQAELWAAANDVEMLPAVALGDEPGDAFSFGGGEIVVPNRPGAAYVNEFVILWRLAMKRLPDTGREDQE